MAGEQWLYNRPLPGARVNMAHPLSKGLVGCWLLNENGGMRAMDLSPYGNHGLLTGFVDPPLRAFNGIYFDGSNDYVDCGSGESLRLTRDLTLEAWVKPANVTGYKTIIDKFLTGARDCYLFTLSDTELELDLDNGTTNEAFSTSGLVVITADWQQVAATFDGANVRLLHNGRLGRELARTTVLSTSTEVVKIGSDTAWARYHTGHIGLVRIYNVALSNEDIRALYVSPYRPMGVPLFI